MSRIAELEDEWRDAARDQAEARLALDGIVRQGVSADDPATVALLKNLDRAAGRYAAVTADLFAYAKTLKPQAS